MLGTLLAWLREDGALMRGSPRPFLLVLVFGMTVGWFGVDRLRSERASIQAERIGLLEGQLRSENQETDAGPSVTDDSDAVAPGPAGQSEIAPPATEPTSEREDSALEEQPAQQSGISQRSEGANSPNVVTTGPNSPVVINPRRGWEPLTASEEDALVEALAPFSGQPIRVVEMNPDASSSMLARQLSVVFNRSGWGVSFVSSMAFINPAGEVPTGIQLHVRQDLQDAASAQALVLALSVLFEDELRATLSPDGEERAIVVTVHPRNLN